MDLNDSWLNFGSLVLGVAAWCFPLLYASRKASHRGRVGRGYAAASILCCALSLLVQLICQYHMTMMGYWSAMADTSGAVVFAAVVMVTVTVLLNLVFFRDELKQKPR